MEGGKKDVVMMGRVGVREGKRWERRENDKNLYVQRGKCVKVMREENGDDGMVSAK